MVDDQHDDADDVTDADDDFEAAVGNFAPGLLARVRSGALTRGIVAVMPGLGARGDDGGWVVECTFAWLNRNRCLAKDVEVTIESAVAWLYIASVKLTSRRLKRYERR